MGRQPLLVRQPDIQERVCELLRTGEYAATVCATLGISERSYMRWRQRGEQAQAWLDDDPNGDTMLTSIQRLDANLAARAQRKRQPHPAAQTKRAREWPELPYWRFWQATNEAQALPERQAIEAIVASGMGGQLLERRVTEGKDGTTTYERYAPPQWQALMTLLSRRHRERWAPSATTEVVTRPPVGDDDPAQALLTQLAELRAQSEANVVALYGKRDKREVG